MKAQSFFEQNGGTYMQVGDYYIPDLKDKSRDIISSENMAGCGSGIYRRIVRFCS